MMVSYSDGVDITVKMQHGKGRARKVCGRACGGPGIGTRPKASEALTARRWRRQVRGPGVSVRPGSPQLAAPARAVQQETRRR